MTRIHASIPAIILHIAIAGLALGLAAPVHSQPWNPADASLLRLEASRAFIAANPGWHTGPQTVSFTGSLPQTELFNDMRWFLARNAEVSFSFRNCRFPDGFDTAHLRTEWTKELQQIVKQANDDAFRTWTGSSFESLVLRLRASRGIVMFPVRGLTFADCAFGSPGTTGTSLRLVNLYAVGDILLKGVAVNGRLSIHNTGVAGSLGLVGLTADIGQLSSLLVSKELRLASARFVDGLTMERVESRRIDCNNCGSGKRAEFLRVSADHLSISDSDFGEEIALRSVNLESLTVHGPDSGRPNAERWIIDHSAIRRTTLVGAVFTAAVKISFLDTRPKPLMVSPTRSDGQREPAAIVIYGCVFDGRFSITDSQLDPSFRLAKTTFGSTFSVVRNRYYDDADPETRRYFELSLREVQFTDLDVPWDQLPEPREWNGLHRPAKGDHLREHEYLAFLRQLEATYEAAGNLQDRNSARLTRRQAELQMSRRQGGVTALFAKLEQHTWGAWFNYGTSMANAPLAYLLVSSLILIMLVAADCRMHSAATEESELRNLRRFGIRLFSPPHEYVRPSREGLGTELDVGSWWQTCALTVLVAVALVAKVGPTHVVMVPTRYRHAAFALATLGWLAGYVLLVALGITLYNTQPAVYGLFHGLLAKGG